MHEKNKTVLFISKNISPGHPSQKVIYSCLHMSPFYSDSSDVDEAVPVLFWVIKSLNCLKVCLERVQINLIFMAAGGVSSHKALLYSPEGSSS